MNFDPNPNMYIKIYILFLPQTRVSSSRLAAFHTHQLLPAE